MLGAPSGAPLLVIIPAQNSMAVRTIIHAANQPDKYRPLDFLRPRRAHTVCSDTRRGDTDTAKQTSMMESAEQILRTRRTHIPASASGHGYCTLGERRASDLQVGPQDPIRLASGDLLWLSTDDDVGPPLADRIEDWVLATLTTRERWHRDEPTGALQRLQRHTFPRT